MKRPTRPRATAAVLLLALTMLSIPIPARASEPARSGDAGAEAAPPKPSGASLSEKLACAYLLVGGAIMLYYGPKERENGRLTMDGKSEAVGGGAAIVLSVALLRDILKRRPSSSHP
jgi:hypothetical protein